MEVAYKRELNHNYLYLKIDNTEADSYEVRMLINNSIEGLLKFRVKCIDSQSFFCYDITSRQPLDRILSGRFITIEEIKKLVIELILTLERMENYLLEGGGLWLEPEYIYIQPEAFTAAFCFVPAGKSEFSKSLTQLFQYILSRVDNQDKDSVVLAYSLYQESLKENIGLEDFIKLIKTDNEIEGEKDKADEEYQQYRCNPSNDEEESEGENGNEIVNNKKKPGYFAYSFFALICASAGIWFIWGSKGFSKAWFAILAAAMVWCIAFAIVKCSNNNKEELPDEIYDEWKLIADDEESEDIERETDLRNDKADEGTVLLVNLRKENHVLEYLSEKRENIDISYFPFIIGKHPDLADCVIEAEGISRLHFRINREIDGYSITDLNSTNGTFLNGRIMEANETSALASGDIIAVANKELRFI